MHLRKNQRKLEILMRNLFKALLYSSLFLDRLNLIKKRHGSQMLIKKIWLLNHTSHTKVYFNEFVANILHDNMGMIILTSEIVEAGKGQKHHI